jgi:hypothetical protein
MKSNLDLANATRAISEWFAMDAQRNDGAIWYGRAGRQRVVAALLGGTISRAAGSLMPGRAEHTSSSSRDRAIRHAKSTLAWFSPHRADRRWSVRA